jgi:hypothetical protein
MTKFLSYICSVFFFTYATCVCEEIQINTISEPDITIFVLNEPADIVPRVEYPPANISQHLVLYQTEKISVDISETSNISTVESDSFAVNIDEEVSTVESDSFAVNIDEEVSTVDVIAVNIADENISVSPAFARSVSFASVLNVGTPIDFGFISPKNITKEYDEFTFSINYRWSKPYGQFMNALLKDTIKARDSGDIEAYERNAERYTTWADQYLLRIRPRQH